MALRLPHPTTEDEDIANSKRLYVGPIFIDGFTHYTQLGEKWHYVSGNGAISQVNGAWGTGCVNWPGENSATENSNYLQLTLQHLKRNSIQTWFNFKCDNFSGAQFLRFYDNTQQYICGFGITPMGHPFISQGGADNVQTRVYPYPVAIEPGKYHTLKVGVGIVAPAPTNTLYMQFSLDGLPITSFGIPQVVLDSTLIRIRHIRLGPMGKNSSISDFVLTAHNFWINAFNNIVTGTADVEFVIGVNARNCAASVTRVRYDQACYANLACGTLQFSIETDGDFYRGATYSNIENYGTGHYTVNYLGLPYLVYDHPRAALLPAFGSSGYDISNMYHADNVWAFLWSPAAIMDPNRFYGEMAWPTPGEI